MEIFKYKVAWCPICNQGWVQIVKEKETNKLFVCCRECESEWNSPIDIPNRNSATQNNFGLICQPKFDEIMKLGWNNYIIKK